MVKKFHLHNRRVGTNHLVTSQNVTFYFYFWLLCWRFGQFCFSRRIGILVLLYSEGIGWDSSLCCRLSQWVWAACSFFSPCWMQFLTPLHGPHSTWTARCTFSSSLLKKKNRMKLLNQLHSVSTKISYNKTLLTPRAIQLWFAPWCPLWVVGSFPNKTHHFYIENRGVYIITIILLS